MSTEKRCATCVHLGAKLSDEGPYHLCTEIVSNSTLPAYFVEFDDEPEYENLRVLPTFGCALHEEKP